MLRAAILAAPLLALTTPSVAQAPATAAQKQARSVPVPGKPAQPPPQTAGAAAAIGGGWNPDLRKNEPEPAPTAAPAPPTDQSEIVRRVNDYLNSVVHLQGTFQQVDANNQRSKGRFYVQRPGKIRFDFQAPSAQRIVADGKYVAIEDTDLKTVDKFPLENTPFRILLAGDVDLFRDARIVAVDETGDTLSVTVEDRNQDAAGRIRLVFDKGASMKLKEWVVTDGQGLDTRITVANLVEGKQQSAEFFAPTPTQFPGLRN